MFYLIYLLLYFFFLSKLLKKNSFDSVMIVVKNKRKAGRSPGWKKPLLLQVWKAICSISEWRFNSHDAGREDKHPASIQLAGLDYMTGWRLADDWLICSRRDSEERRHKYFYHFRVPGSFHLTQYLSCAQTSPAPDTIPCTHKVLMEAERCTRNGSWNGQRTGKSRV